MPIPLIAAALAAIAPTLTSKGLDLLGGIFSGAVTKGTEKVAELIEEKTGIKIEDIAEDKLDEGQWRSLQDFEANNRAAILAAYVQLDAHDVERERIAQSDRADARAAQVKAAASGDRVAAKFIYIYASLLTILTFVFIFYASFLHDYATHPGSERIIDTVLGFLLGVALSAVVQYFFGSSAGSKSKEDKLSVLLNEDRK